MRGRQVFLDSLVAHGVEAVFGNPGTTENPLLDSLIDYPQLPYYVALQESVAMSAATTYSNATGKPSLVNLHVAPGLGNAIGMMFGALKAQAPVIVTAGQQDTRMRLREPLLSYDLVAMAAPVTKWSVEPRTADEMGPLMARAFKIAMTPPRGPVFVSLPVDVMSNDTSIGVSTAGADLVPGPAAEEHLTEIAAALSGAKKPVIVAGDDVATYGGVDALVQLAEATGAAVYQEGIRAHNNFPNRHPNHRGRMPFFATAIASTLADYDVALLVGGQFFEELWLDEVPIIPDGTRVYQVECSAQRLAFSFGVHHGAVGHVGQTLAALAERVPATPGAADLNEGHAATAANSRAQIAKALDASAGQVPMAPGTAAHALAEALPEDVIIVDESITNSNEVANAIDLAGSHTYFGGRGGGIGQGIAGVIGAGVAFPDRPVVCLSGDGSAMYSIQALWSAAHHNLPILFVIWANREYRVLKHNLDIYRQRYDAASNNPYPHMDLDGPVLDFVGIAAGHGISGQLIDDPAKIGPAVEAALAAKKPHLLEIVIAGKEEI